MKTLYIDCGMGAAGDMLTAALLEIIPDKNAFADKMNSLGIPCVEFSFETMSKCGINGTHVSVTVNGIEEASKDDGKEHGEHHHDHHHNEAEHHEHSHHHSRLSDVAQIVGNLSVSEKVKKDVLAVYNLIAEAESAAHGKPVTEIHFHEVGNMDAIADVTAVCLLMEIIEPERVVASPVHVGSGHVHCAHGILPIPAPATAYILKGVPIYGGKIKGELCTPTGAALLKYFVDAFEDMPVMKTEAIGYGMGKKDFEVANCVRVMMGDTDHKKENVIELNFNVDDMSAEEIGFALEKLFDAGAFEAFSVPVGMKKSRPGTLVRVLCSEACEAKIVETIFKHTTTIGMRKVVCDRYILDRKITTVDTEFGPVRCKVSSGYGVKKTKLEYDDLARIAKERDMSIEEVRKIISSQILQ